MATDATIGVREDVLALAIVLEVLTCLDWFLSR